MAASATETGRSKGRKTTKDLTDGEGSVSSNDKDFEAEMNEEPLRKRVKKEKIDNDYIHENGMDILDKYDTSPEDSEHENGNGDPEYLPNGKAMVKGEPGMMPQIMSSANLDSAIDSAVQGTGLPKKVNISGASIMAKATTRTRRGGGGGRRLSYSPETDKQLLDWVVERSQNGLPVSREAIQNQALALVRDECPDFKASSGWVEKFLIRHKISLPTRASLLENGSTRRGPPPLISNGTGSPSTSPTRSPQSGNLSEADRIEDGAGNPEVSGDPNGKAPAEQMLGMHRRMGGGRKRGLKDTKDEEDEEEDDGDDGEGELEKIVPENVNPERLKAFNVFVRLFVDENLDRLVPISKQPKEKVLAIIHACHRQFPEFHDRARKRIRTYLKSCRRMKKPNEPLRRTADQINAVPSMSSAQMQEVNNILASACANEANLGDRAEVSAVQTPPIPAQASSNKSSLTNGRAVSPVETSRQSVSTMTSSSSTPPPPAPRSMVSTMSRLPLAAVAPESLAAARAKAGAEYKLNTTEVTAIRQLIASYRESAAFLYRSADELEALLPASMLPPQKAVR
ncbi:nucleolar protein 4-like isoform X2 [Dendronephthya gigantea]|uniref:nucleolar protein 4-like isoform X2 n=1 Tax=Dendronephthya gigantea TaxID=151771 RepID=UPI00106BB41A|nr:nucleolar protein 4-like isoform X2 [Dendronephthya gigantea]